VYHHSMLNFVCIGFFWDESKVVCRERDREQDLHSSDKNWVSKVDNSVF